MVYSPYTTFIRRLILDSFEIIDQKRFMNHLLKSNLFDSFEVHEVTLHTAFKVIIDGKRNHAYFKEWKDDTLPLDSEFLGWSEMRPFVYELIQGKQLPTFFKIILSTTMPNLTETYPHATNFYFNILFKERQITCSTGVAYDHFTLDKQADQIWDKRMGEFLLDYEFIK